MPLLIHFCHPRHPPPHPPPPPQSAFASPSTPPFPSTHQSLALASPLRTYGMMDRRASGASKARGHLPGAPHCRGAPGPAFSTSTPRVCFKTRTHTHTRHSRSYYGIGYLTLAAELSCSALSLSQQLCEGFLSWV